MTRHRFTGPGATVDGLEPHHAHQSTDTFPVDPLDLTLQPGGYLACSVERRGQVLTVYQLHITGTGVLLRATGADGPPPHAAALRSATQAALQEILLYLELTNLLV